MGGGDGWHHLVSGGSGQLLSSATGLINPAGRAAAGGARDRSVLASHGHPDQKKLWTPVHGRGTGAHSCCWPLLVVDRR